MHHVASLLSKHFSFFVANCSYLHHTTYIPTHQSQLKISILVINQYTSDIHSTMADNTIAIIYLTSLIKGWSDHMTSHAPTSTMDISDRKGMIRPCVPWSSYFIWSSYAVWWTRQNPEKDHKNSAKCKSINNISFLNVKMPVSYSSKLHFSAFSPTLLKNVSCRLPLKIFFKQQKNFFFLWGIYYWNIWN